MGTHEPERDGDLEIEVSPLHAPTPQEPTSMSPHVVARRLLFIPSEARRTRLWRGIAITGALVLVVLALILSITPTREALRGVIFGPTPTATVPVPAGEDKLYISLNPTWGAVSLDGKTLTRLPIEGVNQPLRLSRGRHTIRWRFAPIIDFSCRLSVPSAEGDTCPTRIGILPAKQGIGIAVTLQLSLSVLSLAYRQSLLAAMQTAFDAQQSSEIVRSGERYFLLGQGSATAVAARPLQATLHFVLDADNANATCALVPSGPAANCMMNGDCREICTAPWQSPQNIPGAAFQAYIVAHEVWRYTDFNGHIIADNQPDIYSLLYIGDGDIPMPISVGWDGSHWRVMALINPAPQSNGLPNAGCVGANAAVTFQAYDPPEIHGSQAVFWFYIPGDPVASGCLAVALPANAQDMPDTSPQGLAAAFFVLQRFGVTLAANDAAHRFWPTMPVADAYEQALAQKLAQQLPRLAGAGGNG